MPDLNDDLGEFHYNYILKKLTFSKIHFCNILYYAPSIDVYKKCTEFGSVGKEECDCNDLKLVGNAKFLRHSFSGYGVVVTSRRH